MATDLESRWLLNIAYMATGGYPMECTARPYYLNLPDTRHQHAL